MSRNTMLMLIVLISSLVAMLLEGCGRKSAESDPGPAPVSVQTLEVRSAPTSAGVEVPGTVHAIREAHVAPKVMAKVRQVTVNEGDRVGAGQVLVRLDDADLRAQASQASAAVRAAQAGHRQAETALQMQRVTSSVEVQQAQAGLSAAHANLDKVKRGPRPEQRDQAKQAVEQAQAALNAAQAQLDLVREGARAQEREQAKAEVTRAELAAEAAHQMVVAVEAGARTAEADYGRMKNLADQDVISGQRLDHSRLQFETARAQLAQAQAGEGQAQAALSQARQQLSMVQEGPRTQQVQEAEQAVAQARAGYEHAKLGLTMADRGGRSEDVAAAQAQVRQAEEAVRNAQAAQARNKLREDDVAAAGAGIGQASAGLQAAQVMVNYAIITAPFAGIVSSRGIDPGSMAVPGTPVITVEDDSSYRLEATVPESLQQHLHVGGLVQVALDALGVRWSAEVVELVPAADVGSHTFVAKARLPKDDRVRSGAFGRMIFSTGERDAIVVPDAAIWRDGSLTGVFVVNDSAAELRMVQLGASHDGATEVNSGLADGETIAAVAAGLTDGARVAVPGGEAQ